MLLYWCVCVRCSLVICMCCWLCVMWLLVCRWLVLCCMCRWCVSLCGSLVWLICRIWGWLLRCRCVWLVLVMLWIIFGRWMLLVVVVCCLWMYSVICKCVVVWVSSKCGMWWINGGGICGMVGFVFVCMVWLGYWVYCGFSWNFYYLGNVFKYWRWMCVFL